MENGLSGVWIMDSGCSFHMCPNKSWFYDMREASGSVLLGNNHVCNVRGIGMVKLKMHDGSIKMLSEVRYILEVKRNLVSGSSGTKGIYIHFIWWQDGSQEGAADCDGG